MKDEKGYFYPAVTSDVVFFNIHAAQFREDGAFVNVVLIKRKNEPFKGKWALPGGFLNEGETVQACAYRELEEETGLKAKILIPIGTFSDPKRDPRGPVISNAFAAVFPTTDANPITFKAGDDAAECALFNLKGALDDVSRTIKVKLRCPENGMHTEYTATFSLDPYGVYQEEIVYAKDSNCELAFDHANIIARAINKMPQVILNSELKSQTQNA